MASIADGHEFPQLQTTIDALWDTFNRAHELAAIMNEQFDHNDDAARDTRLKVMSDTLKTEMSTLADNVFAIVEFKHPPRALAA